MSILRIVLLFGSFAVHAQSATTHSLTQPATPENTSTAPARAPIPGLREFASNFHCSDPKLQWQFDNSISLWGENARMAEHSPHRTAKLVTTAADVGGDGEWLYRGVTNQQFDEHQILGVLFNDDTSVSESRWLSGKMFQNAALGGGSGAVALRSQFQNLPEDRRWAAFKQAYTDTRSDIQRLLNQPGSNGENGFSEHVRIDGPYNGTPQAIQFLTPHKDFAEKYGEFVLHVREVVPRGIDVERYNYHDPNTRYSPGSIYVHDRDEYMVPSDIPSWDVEAVKVRDGSGWHGINYGPPLYYYTKVFEPKNPCNVIGVRVDVGQNDDRRKPGGMILRCPDANGHGCQSVWNGATGAAEARLKEVISKTKINGHPVYYVPYELFAAQNKDFLKGLPLSTLAGFLPHLKPEILQDTAFWKTTLLDRFASDPGAALELARKIPGAASFRAEWKDKYTNYLRTSAHDIDSANLKDFFALGQWLDAINPTVVSATVNPLLDKRASRGDAHNALIELARKDPAYRPVLAAATARLATMHDLSTDDQLRLQMARGGSSIDPTLVKDTAKLLATDPAFLDRFWALAGDEAVKTDILEKAVNAAGQDPTHFAVENPFALWETLAPHVSDADRRASLQGSFIDLAIAQKRLSSEQLLDGVARVGLPKDRETDTIRSIWTTTKGRAPAEVNAYKFYSYNILNKMILPLLNAAKARDGRENGPEFTRVRDAAADFWSESISPPEPFVGFSALDQLARLGGKYTSDINWPTADPVVIEVGSKKISVPKAQVQSALASSVATYYLHRQAQEYAQAKSAAEKTRLKTNFTQTTEAYKNYLLTSFERDLAADPFRKRVVIDRVKWNRFENPASLALALAEDEPNPTRKAQLKAVAARIGQLAPELVEVPETTANLKQGFDTFSK